MTHYESVRVSPFLRGDEWKMKDIKKHRYSEVIKHIDSSGKTVEIPTRVYWKVNKELPHIIEQDLE